MKLNRPRNWIILSLLVIVLTVFLAGSAIMSKIIRGRLQSMVGTFLNADLHMASVRYHFPYGVTIGNAVLICAADQQAAPTEIFKVEKLELSLAKLPFGKGPLVIEKLILTNPSVHLVHTSVGLVGEHGLVKQEVVERMQTEQSGPPKKLSQMFHLRRFKIDGGEISYEDRTHPKSTPVVWKDLQVDLNTTPQSGGAVYSYNLVARNLPLADASAQGTMNIDTLVLEVKHFAVTLAVSPGTPQRQLPGDLRKLLLDNQVAGKLVLDGTAQVPLHEPSQAHFSGALDLPDASAKSSAWDASLDRMTLKVHFSDTPPAGVPATGPAVARRLGRTPAMPGASESATPGPSGNAAPGTSESAAPDRTSARYLDDVGADETMRADGASAAAWPASMPVKVAPPLYLTIDKFIAGTGDTQVQVTGGHAVVDPAAGARVRRLNGLLVIGANHDALPTALQSFFDRINLRGKMEFTAAATGPIKPHPAPGQRAVDLIQYELRAYPRELSLQPPDFPRPLEKLAGAIDITPAVISLHNFEAHYGEDHIFIVDARLPLAGIKDDIRINEINGSILFSGHSPKYPSPLDEVMAQTHPQGTFFISGNCSILRNALDEFIAPNEDAAPLSSPDNMPAVGHLHAALPVPVVPLPPAASPAVSAVAAVSPARDKFEYHFDLTSDDAQLGLGPKAVPLTGVKSDISASTHYIQVTSLRATAFDGRIEAKGQARTGRVLAYNGRATVSGVNIKKFAEYWFGSADAAMHLSGSGYANVLVSGTGPRDERTAADNLTAKGEFEILEGSFWELPVIQDVISRVKVAREALTVGQVASTFEVRNQTLYLTNAAISAPVLGLEGSGSVRFDGQVTGQVVAAPLSDWRQQMQQLNIPLVSKAAGALVGGVQKLVNTATRKLLYEFHVTGTLAHPSISIVPAPVLTEGVAALFGHMINFTRDDHLLDALRGQEK